MKDAVEFQHWHIESRGELARQCRLPDPDVPTTETLRTTRQYDRTAVSGNVPGQRQEVATGSPRSPRRSTKQLASSWPASAEQAELHHHAEIVSAGDARRLGLRRRNDGRGSVPRQPSTGRWHHLESVTVLQHECACVPAAHHRARHHGVAFGDGLLLDELELGVAPRSHAMVAAKAA